MGEGEFVKCEVIDPLDVTPPQAKSDQLILSLVIPVPAAFTSISNVPKLAVPVHVPGVAASAGAVKMQSDKSAARIGSVFVRLFAMSCSPLPSVADHSSFELYTPDVRKEMIYVIVNTI